MVITRVFKYLLNHKWKIFIPFKYLKLHPPLLFLVWGLVAPSIHPVYLGLASLLGTGWIYEILF